MEEMSDADVTMEIERQQKMKSDKQRLEEAEDRIDDLESRMKKLITDCAEHKHNIGNKLPTLNY